VNLLNVLLSAWAAFDRTQRHLKHSSFATAKLDTINNFRVFPLTEGKELRLREKRLGLNKHHPAECILIGSVGLKVRSGNKTT